MTLPLAFNEWIRQCHCKMINRWTNEQSSNIGKL